MARASIKKRLAALEPQPEATAELDPELLLAAAAPVLKQLTADLLARADASPAVTSAMKTRHQSEVAQRKTADTFPQWRRHFVDQLAAAWFLSCVFVRTLEDRGLVSRNRIAGSGALDSERSFRQLAPSLTERDYLLAVFRELSRLPAARDLFSAEHNPVWLLGPSADAARALIDLFRTASAEQPAFRFGQPDTRFLGDLYQDLNEDVKKRFALLQTPRFVERFILDRTLDPAIDHFGLEDTTLIDPTCGSGHFLLGAFERLFERHLAAAPGEGARRAAERALDAVFGADINPYAVAIARFRLTLAFLGLAGIEQLDQAPKLPLHLVVADSLLHNPHLEQGKLGHVDGTSIAAWEGEEYALEDEAAARDVLFRSYAAVVGNPPYITVKDKAKRDEYRSMYASAHREYSLAVPFTERFFQLGRKHARVGMITANSFMKREFGKKLIEQYLPTVNLDLIVNTSGAYIPGHGTPTVLLFGSHDAPLGDQLDVVLANRGEPSTPDDPEQGQVWSSIAEHWSDTGFENDYITVATLERRSLNQHPWALSGGGAVELKSTLEDKAAATLGEIADSIGFSVITGEDNVLRAPAEVLVRAGLNVARMRRLVEGEEVRDWAVGAGEHCVWSCTEEGDRLDEQDLGEVLRYLWPYRSALRARKAFGTPVEQRGIPWWALREVYSDRMRTPLTIAFAFVATHNHFVLDRGGKVFKQSAPIIKLPPDATEDDHLALLAYLNSSTACFWMKQVFYPKATSVGDISIEKGKPENNRYEFAGTGLAELPLPPLTAEQSRAALQLAQEADTGASQLADHSGLSAVRTAIADQRPIRDVAQSFEREREALRRRLVVVQEDLDWLMYAAFGLVDGWSATDVAGAEPEERPFRSDTPHSIWRERAATVPDSRHLRLLEDPVFKRLWLGRQGVFGHGSKTFAEEVREAAVTALLEMLEDILRSRSEPLVPSALDTRLLEDKGAQLLLAFLRDAQERVAIGTVLRDASDAVPYLAALRFKEPGLEKYAQWQHTWELQRREDAGEAVGDIPVPPKYAQKDYRDAAYWRLRGKLDVPKERFISYPGCELDDGEPLYGWAGWDHAQRAQALAGLYNARKTKGWEKERLKPMLAGLLELLPWLHQWHAEVDEEYGSSPADDYQNFVDGQCGELGLTYDDLRAWRPPEKKKGGRGKRRK